MDFTSLVTQEAYQFLVEWPEEESRRWPQLFGPLIYRLSFIDYYVFSQIKISII